MQWPSKHASPPKRRTSLAYRLESTNISLALRPDKTVSLFRDRRIPVMPSFDTPTHSISGPEPWLHSTHTMGSLRLAGRESLSAVCVQTDLANRVQSQASHYTHTHHRDRTTTAMEEYSDISPSIILSKWENDAKEISSSYINMTVVEVFWIHLGLYFRTIAIYCISKALVKNGVLDTMPWFWYITYSTHILASWNSTLSM